MFLKKRMIATAAVIAMAAAAVYGSTQEMSQTQDTGAVSYTHLTLPTNSRV
mgnify:CR=1 FL=1